MIQVVYIHTPPVPFRPFYHLFLLTTPTLIRFEGTSLPQQPCTNQTSEKRDGYQSGKQDAAGNRGVHGWQPRRGRGGTNLGSTSLGSKTKSSNSPLSPTCRLRPPHLPHPARWLCCWLDTLEQTDHPQSGPCGRYADNITQAYIHPTTTCRSLQPTKASGVGAHTHHPKMNSGAHTSKNK